MAYVNKFCVSQPLRTAQPQITLTYCICRDWATLHPCDLIPPCSCPKYLAVPGQRERRAHSVPGLTGSDRLQALTPLVATCGFRQGSTGRVLLLQNPQGCFCWSTLFAAAWCSQAGGCLNMAHALTPPRISSALCPWWNTEQPQKWKVCTERILCKEDATSLPT